MSGGTGRARGTATSASARSTPWSAAEIANPMTGRPVRSAAATLSPETRPEASQRIEAERSESKDFGVFFVS